MVAEHDLQVMREIVNGRQDVFAVNGRVYYLFWQTAMDGKTWCRVRVFDQKRNRRYMYGLYFKTKKAARIDIAWHEYERSKAA